MSKKKSAEEQTGENASTVSAAPGQPSERQTLTKRTRDEATTLQTATRPGHAQPAYDVPYIQKTPDESNPKFKNYAASFHKLFEHDPSTGLLTASGVTSYENFLKGLNNPPNTPNSDFNQNALNAVKLANPGPDVPPARPDQSAIVEVSDHQGRRRCGLPLQVSTGYG